MKNVIFCILFFSNFLIEAKSAMPIELKINAFENRIGQLDLLILSAKLINSGAEIKAINDPQSTRFEYRKFGTKEWLFITSLKSTSGSYKTSESGTIYIHPKEDYNFNIGAAFYGNKSNNESGALEWIYANPGKYEIRLAYNLSSFGEDNIIYSNIVQFDIIEYTGVDASAFKYLSQQDVPTFFHDSYYYGSNSTLASNRMNVKEVSKQLISKYSKSRFAIWAKLYLIEMEAYKMSDEPVDKSTAEKKVLEFEKSKNPFIQERLKFLLNHLKKDKN